MSNVKTTVQKKSTNVRMQVIQGLVRHGMGLLSKVNESLAARAAERLFTTPIRHKRPQRELDYLKGARPFDLHLKNHRLAAWSWGEGPTVLLVHGWAGRGSQMGAFAERLVEAGYRVVCFDGPAHGNSPGKRTTLPEFSDVIEEAVWELGPVCAVIAHSFGSMATSLALARGLPIERVVNIGGAAWTPQTPAVIAGHMGVSMPVMDRMRGRLEDRFDLSWENFWAHNLGSQMSIPALIVHDEDDSEIPIKNVQILVDHWSDSRLMRTSGLGHTRILRGPEVVEEVVRFIAAGSSSILPLYRQELLRDIQGAEVA